MSSTPQPPSIGKAEPVSTTESAGPDVALVRLHAALKNLDTAIFDTLRCLDVALGRNPTSTPAAELPHRELGRLRLHLEAATTPAERRPDRNLGDMALTWDDEENDSRPEDAVNA